MARFFVSFACLLLGMTAAPLSAQVTRCSADAHLNVQLESDTAFARSFFALEAALEEMASTGFRSTEEHTLPVVVHIMHAGDAVGSGANLSDAQVASAIAALNADFAGEFGGADTDIQFTLAVRDPAGNPTSGINRVNASATIPSFADQGMVTNNNLAASSEINVKTLSHWPGDEYMNIWVVSKLNGGASPIGFAYLPPTTGLVDGIVVHHQVFGVGEEYDLMNNYDLNRTLTHEVGHYLGLYHTFHLTSGCQSESNCSAQGDRVCDTPPTSGSLSCSALECENTMVENFMDYSNDPCMSSFTEGQRTRMRNALVEHRSSLMESLGQVPVVDLDAGLSSIQGISPQGCAATHSPTAVLQNFGTTPIFDAIVRFALDGGVEHMVTWQGELAPNQTTLVALPELAATVGTHSLTVWTEIPNDEYAGNDAIELDFEVVPGNMLTMEIQFDFLPYGITWAVETTSSNDPILSGGNYVNADFASQFISAEGCATPGCYTLIVEDLFGNGMHYSPPGWYELTDTDGNVLGEGSGNFGDEQSHDFCLEAADVVPCTDENDNGICDDDEGLLVVDIPGCTDAQSCTFNASATIDNGSCEYLDALNDCGGDCPSDNDNDGVCDNAEVPGCTDDTACNYDSGATDENGLCTYPPVNYDCEGNVTNVIAGCTDAQSCTFDSDANTDDGSCQYLDALNDCGGDCPSDNDNDGVCDNAEVPGCTDDTACNYDSGATDENGLCTYPPVNYDCEGNVTNVIAGCTDAQSCTFDSDANTDDGSCQYLDALNDCGGDCPSDNDNDGVCDNAEIPGCTDDTACNYDSGATDENGSCEFAVEGFDCDGNPTVVITGCTDPESCTFDSDANTDDGSCQYLDALNDCGGDCPSDNDNDGVCDNAEVPGCTDDTACNYDSGATDENGSCEFAVEGFDCDGNPLVNSVNGAVGNAPSLMAFPNPVMHGEINLVGLPGPGTYEVHILDMEGRLVSQENVTAHPAGGDWRLRTTLNVKPGLYMMHIAGAQRQVISSGLRILVN